MGTVNPESVCILIGSGSGDERKFMELPRKATEAQVQGQEEVKSRIFLFVWSIIKIAM